MQNFDESSRLISPFIEENSPEKTMLCQIQRLLVEYKMFPSRFPSFSSFVCSICRGKTFNLSFCVTCGRVFCAHDFYTHGCTPCYGVDICTQQVFYCKGETRQFLFNPHFDRLIISAKLAVSDGLPMDSDLDSPTPILSLPKLPLPMFNLGNTCWMNALLQCFLVNPFISKWFLSQVIPTNNPSSIIECVHIQLTRLFLSQETDVQFLTTDCLFCVWVAFPQLCTHEQHDSHEFLMELRNGLIEFYKKYNNSVFSSIFSIQFTVIETCEHCENTRTSITEEMEIIVSTTSASNLNSALAQALKTESPLPCPFCGHQNRREMVFHEYPRTLTITLVKCRGNDRVVSPIKIEETLDLTPYAEPNIGKGIYTLNSAVVRPGTGETGHYWADVRKCDKWFRCDDYNVTHVEQNDVMRDDAYLLFYIRNGFEKARS